MGKYDDLLVEAYPDTTVIPKKGKYADLLDEEGAASPSLDMPAVEQPKESMFEALSRQADGLYKRMGERAEDTQKPTVLGNAVEDVTGSNFLGQAAAVPERALRMGGQIAGNIVDIPFTGAGQLATIAGRMVPQGVKETGKKAAGGLLGLMQPEKLKDVVNALVSPEERKALVEGYKKLPEAIKLDINSAANIAGVLPIGKTAKAGGETLAELVSKISSTGTKAIGRTAAAGSEGAYKVLGSIAEQLSDVPKETLGSYGWGIGKEATKIKKYAGKQHEIADELLKAIDNYDEYMPEGKAVGEALKQMPPINIGNTVNRLKAAKESVAGTPSAISGNNQINKMIETLVSVADENGNLPASKFKRVREQIDAEISAAFNKDYKTGVERAGLSARNQMMDDLITTAENTGNQSYINSMKEWSRKLQVAEKLKGYIGKSPEARERHIDSFVKNVFNENKDRAREALSALGEVVDNNLLEKAKYASMASQLGATGKPGLFSPVKTGSVMKMGSLAGGAGYAASQGHIGSALGLSSLAALGSPMIASKVLGPIKVVRDALVSKFKVPVSKADDIAVVVAENMDIQRLPISDMSQEELYSVIGKNIPESIKSKTDPFWNLPTVGSVDDKITQGARTKIELPKTVEQLDDQQTRGLGQRGAVGGVVYKNAIPRRYTIYKPNDIFRDVPDSEIERIWGRDPAPDYLKTQRTIPKDLSEYEILQIRQQITDEAIANDPKFWSKLEKSIEKRLPDITDPEDRYYKKRDLLLEVQGDLGNYPINEAQDRLYKRFDDALKEYGLIKDAGEKKYAAKRLKDYKTVIDALDENSPWKRDVSSSGNTVLPILGLTGLGAGGALAGGLTLEQMIKNMNSKEK